MNESLKVQYKHPGAKTVPRNPANKNRTAKTNEKMQISAIKSIENIAENPEECEHSSGFFVYRKAATAAMK